MAWDRAVSSSDEEGGEQGKSKPPKLIKHKQQKPPDSCPLRSDLRHGEDYFLVGPNVWLLVKEKFGFDNVELGRPVVSHNSEESTLAVAIDHHPHNGSARKSTTQNKQLIPIPPAGHFPYHILIKDLEGDSEESFLPKGRPPQQQPLQQAEQKQSDVVSDEDADPNDLVSFFFSDFLNSLHIGSQILGDAHTVV
jgi:hypothetical protein